MVFVDRCVEWLMSPRFDHVVWVGAAVAAAAGLVVLAGSVLRAVL